MQSSENVTGMILDLLSGNPYKIFKIKRQSFEEDDN